MKKIMIHAKVVIRENRNSQKTKFLKKLNINFFKFDLIEFLISFKMVSLTVHDFG